MGARLRGMLVAGLTGSILLTGAAPTGAARLAGPTVSVAPIVVGIARQGAKLAGAPGSWAGSGAITEAYQWYRCDASGAHCGSIHGSTKATYRLVVADVGKTIGLTVKATDPSGTTSAYASLVGPIAPAPTRISSTVQPSIVGAVALGKKLTVGAGVWSTTPGSVRYAWERCNPNGRVCAPIAGATGAVHTVVAADAGHALVALVQASAGTATQTALSTAVVVKGGVAPPAPVTPAPSSGVPVVSGTLRLGERLTASGTTGTPAYQWYRCDESGARCGSVHGATKATYTLVAADVGKTIGLTVKTTDAAGAATSTYASLVGPVAPKTIQLVSTARPTIEGTPAKGQSLKPSGGTWTATPTSFGYAWERCNANGRICVPIAGATAESYTATADDVGHALVVIVQATASAGITTTWSAATPAVKAAIGPTATKAPTVAGTALQGSKLTAAAGTWSGQGAVTYAYQWFRCDAVGAHCNSIHGATKSTYTLVAADVGKTIGLTVRATDATGTAPAYASLVGPIAAASAPASSTAQPAIQGDAVQGAALKAGTGSWSSTPTSFSYLWLRCNANGRICSLVTGATAVTYTPVAADVGHALLSVVEASIGGTVQTAFSTATAPVRATATTP